MKSSEKMQKEMTALTPSIGVDGGQSNHMNNLSLPQTKEQCKGELSDFPQLPHEKHFKMHRISDIVSENRVEDLNIIKRSEKLNLLPTCAE
ncbi:MAG: hypothetical protein R3Y07_05045 [Eubacteriales bacterium]